MNIIICNNCNGEGKKLIDTGDHKTEWSLVQCKSCHGTGRKLRREFSFEMSYGLSEKVFLDTEKKILKVLEEVEMEIRKLNENESRNQ